MLFNHEPKYDYTDVVMEPKKAPTNSGITLSSRSLVKIDREFTFKWSSRTRYGVGIIASNMDTVGTIPMARALVKHNVFTALHKHIDYQQLKKLYGEADANNFMFYTMGASDAEFNKLGPLFHHNVIPEMICIDIANGYLDMLITQIKRVRDYFPDTIIMAGNVVTGDRTIELIEAGADIVKVGIGPGSACTTRKLTGVGMPQLSAVAECSLAAQSVGGMVCADGGCVDPGHVGMAFNAGADFVMLGGMLAGHEECEGSIIEYKKVLNSEVECCQFDGQMHFKYYESFYVSISHLPAHAWKMIPLEVPEMVFYGMSSATAMKKYNGGVAEYRAAEGRTVQIPFRGPVEETILEILGGLRSTMTYIGCDDIQNMAYCAEFHPVRHQYNTVFVK